MVELSIITVSHNNQNTIKGYLESVAKYLPENSEIIVVDSGSTDKTLEIIRRYSQVKLIESKENIGFGRGSNLAAQKALGSYLLFLNPDCRIYEESVNTLLKFIKSHPEAGIVAPKLVESGGDIQPSVRKLPTVTGVIKEYYLGIKNSYRDFVPIGGNAIEVESAVGAALMLRKDIFEKIGGFDEKFFMYFEDLDLCRKVRSAGYKIFYIPASTIQHRIGASFHPNKVKWLNDSAKIYHGALKYFFLNLLLKLRPIK